MCINCKNSKYVIYIDYNYPQRCREFVKKLEESKKVCIMSYSIPKELKYLQNLEELVINSSNITSICDMNIKSLTCKDCPHLRYVSNLRNLQSIYCWNCTKFEEIRGCYNLVHMRMMDAKIHTVSGFQKLEKLYIYGVECVNLYDLPSLKSLSCHSFDSIDLPSLEYLDCSEGESFLPNMDIYVGKKKVRFIPYLEKLKELYISSVSDDIYYINKTPEAIKYNCGSIILSSSETLKSLNIISFRHRNGFNIPSFPSLRRLLLKNLNISVPCIPSLRNLCFSNCTVYIIGRMNLKVLSCNRCEIYNIPDFFSLKELNCIGTNISIIPYYPQLTKLECSHCEELKEIPYLPTLRDLRCIGTNISVIPEIKSLTTLYCSGCRNIERIPSLPNLTTLSTDSSLPNELPKLKTLDISNSDIIEEIPYYPNLEYLIAYCSNIRSIQYFPKLHSMNVYDCDNLFSIEHIPRENGNYLRIYNNESLSVISNEEKNDSMWSGRYGYWFSDRERKIEKIKTVQRFCKRYVKYRLFMRWIKSREFAEFFYDPNNIGGKISKRIIEKEVGLL